MSPNKSPNPYHERSVFGGFVWGVILSGIVMLFWGPRFPWSGIKQAQVTFRDKIDQTMNADPINDGIQQGKDVARQLMGNDRN